MAGRGDSQDRRPPNCGTRREFRAGSKAVSGGCVVYRRAAIVPRMADTSEQQAGQQDVWTVGRLLEWTTQWFDQKQVEGGRLAAELLLAKALACRKIDLYTRWQVEPDEAQRSLFRELVRSAAKHVPIAYLLGVREFFSLEFEVTPAVLIPRPETETLVQRMVDLCRTSAERTWEILDVGTGTGCVAVAIAKYAANARLVAGDVSSEAVEVARRNVARHGLDGRIQVLQADCVALPADAIPAEGFDAIVSNPPYISEADWQTLPPHIRDHEPRIALTQEGSDGLVLYRRLAAEAPSILKSDGYLLAEIGHKQLADVRSVFDTAGGWRFVGSHRDGCDPHERVVEFVRTN